MSFTDRLMIWLHVAFVIFAIGPVTIAVLASPRYIRVRNVAVLRYLLRTTRIFGVASLGVLIFGIVAAQQLHKLGSAWVSASETLFVVALVLLVVIMRDQRHAVVALEAAHENEALSAAASNVPASSTPAGETPDITPGEAAPAQAPTRTPTIDGPNAPAHTANVERGRIASMAGIVTLIWLAILVLMIWNS